MTHSDWMLLGILALQTCAQVAMWADKWVHKQADENSDYGKRIKSLEDRVSLASDRSSDRQGALTQHLILVDLALKELQTIVRLRGMDRS